MKRLGIASFTARGGRVADSVAAAFEKEYEIVRYEGSLKEWCGGLFASGADGIIFVGACGIAVRTIAPFIKSKTTDPAVLVVDEAGQFVISLLSGHIGGANRLAVQAAEILGATPVITTATDVNGKFAVDVFAKENALRIGSMRAAKEISAALLRGEKIGVLCEGRIEGELPPELVLLEDDNWEEKKQSRPAQTNFEEKMPAHLGGIITIGSGRWADAARIEWMHSNAIGSWADAAQTEWAHANALEPMEAETSVKGSQLPPVVLHLYPNAYVLGIGCRKGKAEQEITKAVQRAIDMLGITMEDIAGAASIELKKEEPGLLEFCRKNKLQFETYSAEVLAAVEGNFSPSSFVKHVTGVDNVCERAALCMAREMSGQPDLEPVRNEWPARTRVEEAARYGQPDSEPVRNEWLARTKIEEAAGYEQPDTTEAGGRLILRKQAEDGVTVAVAEKSWSVRF
ncbi:MAG: cobalamin biosynthesis protein [Lachnospiraceae bacterium]|nr:cobalamin biosynthesis protein [Lachnospiraceae bacterium]